MPDTSPPEPEMPSARRVKVWLPLSHHYRRDLDRCLLVPLLGAKVAVCTRCVALYPTALVTLLLQALLEPRAFGVWDWLWVLGGTAPALVDWGLAWLGRRRGTTRSRLVTGVLLGGALGRSLWLYLHDPSSEVFWVHAGLVVVAALSFELVRRLRL